jgi:SAM-dependent methyltransferase
MDWSVGTYERTARQLLPAARIVVEAAAVARDEHVVDVGCGTGNAALLAAEQGARVTGVDPAPRLLDVARAAADDRGLIAQFLSGRAEEIPLPDGGADVVLSVFGIIFAEDPARAAAEMLRVAGPDGRILFSAWIPDGAISRAVRASREAIVAAGAPEGPPPFPWNEAEAVGDLFGSDVAVEEHAIAFTDASPERYVQEEFDNHPLWVAGRPILEQSGQIEPLRDRVLTIFREANEDPSALRITSRWVVVSLV